MVALALPGVAVTLLSAIAPGPPHPAATPPLGFNHCNLACGKDWNASMQMRMMNGMVAQPGGGGSSLRDAGYVFANLDDGWMLAPPAAGPRRGAQAADTDWLAAGGLVDG